MFAKLHPIRRSASVCALSLLATAALAQTTINVGPSQTYYTIQSGIDAANNGDTVLVAPGTYNENINFNGKAITVTSSGGASTTIIDGGSAGPAVTFKTGETSASTISGFTIQHGGQFGWINEYSNYGVGNIYLYYSAPTILNNTITLGNCWGIEARYSAPIIENNTISATQDPIGNCSFGGGAAIIVWGGMNGYNSQGVNSGLILGNTIENNVESGLEDAGGNGGAGIAVWGGSPIIMNNIIRNNASPGGSGGAINFMNSQGVVIAQNLIYGNSAGCGGGAIATNGQGSYFVNNTIVDNVGLDNWGFSECISIAQIYPTPDAYGRDNPSDIFINNIISGSTPYPAVNCSWGGPPSESIQPTFQNNILYNAGGPFFGSYCVDVSDEYNNIASDPQFVSPSMGDFHLKSTSPAIDSGQNSVLETFKTMTGLAWTKDIGGNPRVQDGSGKGCIIDMGAYEYRGSSSNCGTTETLSSSLNPAMAGQSVTFTAQLSADSGIPTGAIQFLDGANLLSTQTVSGTGSAAFSTNSLTVGSHTITANYQPTGTFDASTASLTQVINGYTTGTALTCLPNPIDIYNTAQLSATVTSANGTPTGSITFTDNGATLATQGLLNGATSLTYTGSIVGTHSITATYTPAGSFAASSATCSEVVNALPITTTTLSASATNLTVGQILTLTATVTPASGATPTGTVTFYNGTASLGSATLNGSGMAQLILTPAVGNYSITASYGGSPTDAASTSSPAVTVTVTSGTITSPNIYTYAGNGIQGFSGDGKQAINAELNYPGGVVTDAAGNVYFADDGENRVRRIDRATGVITTVAGTGVATYSGDGDLAVNAALNYPFDVALDAQENLYIADAWNACIRKVDRKTGIITTVAGMCGTLGISGNGGPATNAKLILPQGIALDAFGNLYISDSGWGVVRKVDAITGIITAFAGVGGGVTSSGDGGPATAAHIVSPFGVTVDSAQNVYIVDWYSAEIRKVDAATGIISTVAGTGTPGYSDDGGLATKAQLYQPSFAKMDAADNLCFSDSSYGRIRKIDSKTGIITRIAGIGGAGFSGDGGPAIDALMNYPEGFSFDQFGNFFIADAFNRRIRVVGVLPVPTLIATTTALAASATSLTVGQTLTLTATVTPASGATPTGTVTFYNGTASLGSATLNGSGIATLQSMPAVGNYSITASYGGSSTDASSVSSPAIAVSVNAISTTTALNAAPTSLSYGQTLTLTATVTPASGATPTGTVTFYNGTASLGSATLNGSGIATLQSMPAVGSYSITARYGGSTNDLVSTSSPPIAVNVIASATTTSLIASPNPAPFGATVTFTATVANSASGSTITPAGSVSYYDGTTLLGTSTLASGVATYSTGTLSVGSHNITAAYAATTGFNASTSPTVVEVISPADFQISASPASQTIYTGEAATYTVAITPGTGFNLPVALSCTQLPANTTCSFSPATVPGGSTSSTLVVQTSAPLQATSVFVLSNRLRVPMLAGLVLLFIPRRLRRFRNGWPMCLLLLALLIAAAAITGCSAPRTLLGGTPVGAPNITITGTATNGSQTLTHATSVTLDVKSLF